MAEKIAFENGRIYNYKGLVTLTMDWVILHTVVQHSSTSTYMPNFIKIEETFCGRTDGRTYTMTDGRCQVQSHVTQILRQILKIRPDQI